LSSKPNMEGEKRVKVEEAVEKNELQVSIDPVH
jgi:hypothetical protein